MLNKTLIFNLLCLLTINLNGQFDPDLESFSQILIEENPEQTLYFNHKVTKRNLFIEFHESIIFRPIHYIALTSLNLMIY